MIRVALPWILLTLALAAATAPAWGRLATGYDPTLDALPSLRCGPKPSDS